MDHPTELAAILGTDVTTVQRWLRGEKLPRRVRPWPAEAPPVDGSLGAAFRRIWIDAINPATFVASQREMLDETVARWPQQQAWIDADGEPRERALADLGPARALQLGLWGRACARRGRGRQRGAD